MFNVQGSEFLFLLVVALIILGPEKLPDAVRKFGRAYGEFKKMANGFQGEIRSALDEPMRELRDTADAMRAAANFDLGGIMGGTATEPEAESTAPTPAPAASDSGLNFGSAIPRRTRQPSDDTVAGDDAPADDAPAADDLAATAPETPAAEPGDPVE